MFIDPTRSNRRSQPARFDLQLSRTSYPAITQLIEQGRLIASPRPTAEADDPVKGVRAATTFRLADGVDLSPISDHTIRIGEATLAGQFAHLPSPAYHALVTAAPSFLSHPGMDELLHLARQADTDLRQLTDLILQITSTEPTPDVGPQMSARSTQFHATWRPDLTLIKCTAGGEYFLTLAFTLTFTRVSQAPRTTHVGLDAGLDPFSAAVHDDGQAVLFTPTRLHLPDRRTLHGPAAQLLDDVVYASGRADAERLIAHLTHRAHRVAAERLRLDDMYRPYVLRSRDRALQDLHHAWLPQFLNAAGVPFIRVAAGYTSLRCPMDGYTDRRNRVGKRFRCRSCGYEQHADIVGGMNVLAYDQRNQKRRLAA